MLVAKDSTNITRTRINFVIFSIIINCYGKNAAFYIVFLYITIFMNENPLLNENFQYILMLAPNTISKRKVTHTVSFRQTVNFKGFKCNLFCIPTIRKFCLFLTFHLLTCKNLKMLYINMNCSNHKACYNIENSIELILLLCPQHTVKLPISFLG